MKNLCPLLLLAGCAFEWEPSFEERTSYETFEQVAIADPAVALTFARTTDDRVLLVRRYEGDAVEARDVSSAAGHELDDPIAIFEALGYDGLLAEAGLEDGWEMVSVDRLGIPLPLRDHHVAAGTNYPEHAGEVGAEVPYLFPKLVDPTPWNAEVSVGQALLDYEVELAFVPFEPLREGDEPERLGLILANDFSDRATLLRHLDPDDVESGRGFTTGKSFRGFLPVGNLFVVPRDPRAFAPDLQLRLYVNGELRQRDVHASATWDLDEILAQTWARRDVTWEHRGQQVSLFEGAEPVVLDRTLVLTGTPSGVVFNEIGFEQRASALLDWLGGNWGDTLPDRAIADYITDAQAAGVYLLTGDRVDIHVDRLGVIRSEIVR